MSNSSLYGTSTTTGTVASSNFTTLYSGSPSAVPVGVVGNTTYNIASGVVTGGANLLLNGSDGSVDSVKYASGLGITVSSTDNNTILITNTSTAGTTYAIDASATTGGANFNLVGSDATTDTIKFAAGTNISIVRTDANTITVNNTAPDANTTYQIDASATTGGANLNLVGSDATTDTIKYASAGGTTVTRTDANTITISSAGSGGAIALNDLSDVIITPPLASGQLLTYDGTEWINSSLITATASADRARFQYNNSTAGPSSALFLRKNFGASTYTTADGVGLSFQLESNTQASKSIGFMGVSYDAALPYYTLNTSLDGITFTPVATLSTDNAIMHNNLTVLGGIISTTATTADIFAANATTVNAFGAATTITIAANTGTTTIRNDLVVDGSVSTNFLIIDTKSTIDTGSITTTSVTPVVLASSTRTAFDALVTVVQGANTHVVKAIVLRNGAAAMITTYGEMYNNISLASFSADVNAGSIRLLVTPTSATSTVFNAVRTSLD